MPNFVRVSLRGICRQSPTLSLTLTLTLTLSLSLTLTLFLTLTLTLPLTLTLALTLSAPLGAGPPSSRAAHRRVHPGAHSPRGAGAAQGEVVPAHEQPVGLGVEPTTLV